MHWSSNALSASISAFAKNSASSIPASLNDFGIPKNSFNSLTFAINEFIPSYTVSAFKPTFLAI